MVGSVASDILLQGKQQVIEFPVHHLDLIGSMVTQQVIDGRQLLGNIITIRPVGGLDAFPGVQVVKLQCPFTTYFQTGKGTRGCQQTEQPGS